MSELAFHAVFDGPLLGVNARFGPGCSSLLGEDPVALAALVALAAGAREPRRGQVLLDGVALHASPERRRAASALLADESVPPLARVSDALDAVLVARGEERRGRALLESCGLVSWGDRRPKDLDASERRTLGLALSLTHPNPRLLALYEPFAAGRSLAADFVRAGVERAVAAGAVVLVATQSLDDARTLGAVPWLFARGVLASAAEVSPGAPGHGERALVVETPDARRLTAALAREPSVRGVRWNEAHAPDTVLVFGSDIELLSSAVVRALGAEPLRVRSMALAPAPLAALFASPVAQAPAAGALPQAPYAAPPVPYAMPGASYPAPAAPYPAPGIFSPAVPEATAPAPADQSVAMPTSFADPTRPPSGGTQ